MRNKLFDYQQEIFDKEKDKDSHALFMDMGTGKTITSLALYDSSPPKNILIICLVSKLEDWAVELKNHFNIDATILGKGTERNRRLLQGKDYLIVNYESVWRLEKELLNIIDDDWFIIVDESHKIKNTKSKIGKFMKKLKTKTKYKCILTGTPQSKGYIDYYNQLYFTDIFTMSEKDFGKNYCLYNMERYNGQYVRVLSGYKNQEELENIIVSNCVFFNREESELSPDEIIVNIKKDKSYDAFRKTRVLGDVVADNIPAYRMGLRQLASGFLKNKEWSHEKQQWLSDLLDSLNERVVIFYNFNTERDMLIELCEYKKLPISQYNGDVKDLTNFLNEENGVAICNYASASTGLNDLVKSRIGVMFSPTEDFILFAQSKKRLDRIGQTKKPLIYYLQSVGTIECAIYDALFKGYDFDDKLFELYLQNVLTND